MSVANQANEKLTQLVSLTAKIESYLNPAKKGKGKGGAEAKTESSEGGGGVKSKIQEAIAVGGMAQSLAMFFKEYRKTKLGDGQNVKSLLVNLSEGISEAAKKLEEVDEKEMLDKIGAVIKGVAGFTVTMVLVGLAAPMFAFGIVVFSLGISAMNFIFNKLVKDSKTMDEALSIISKIGKGAAFFAVAMILIGMAAQPFAFGVIVFTLAVSGMIFVFSKLGSSKVKKSVTDSIAVIFDMAKGAAFFALTMVLIGLTAKLFAFGVIVFTLAMAGMIFIFSKLNGMKKEVGESLKTITAMSRDIAKFALVMVLVGLVSPLFALGVLVVSGGLWLITKVLAGAGKKEKEINKGIKIISTMLKPLALMSILFALVGLAAQQVAIGALVVAGSIVVIGLAAYLVGKFDKDVKKGAVALDVLAPALIMFSVALFILALAPGDPLTLALKMAVVAGAIVVLGLAAYVLGLPAVFPFVELGAMALVTLGAALVVFSVALFILSKANFTKEQGENLGYTIVELGVALAKFGLMAPFALIGAGVLAIASVALLPLTASLAIFKTIGWKESDGESLKNALQSTVQAFAGALDGLGLKGMMKLLAAIPIVALLGLSLTSLAAGIKAMATMTFTEMEWDDKEKKLIPKRQVKISDTEIKAVGPNVAAILNALAEPLRKFGEEAMKGPFSLFGGGYMMKGIQAAGKIGEVISSIAKGVSDMANLNVIEWEVKDGKLVPKDVRKLKEDDFINAGNFTKKILDTLAVPLSEFGESASKGEGWFSSGYMEKGIEAAGKVGNAIASIAKGVSDMATLNIVEYEVKDGKLVPVKSRPLIEDDFINAGNNVRAILEALITPMTDFGKAWEDGSGWFSNSYLESAVKGINAVTDPISKLAKMVTEIASGNAVVNEVKDGKLVPKEAISFADAVPKATNAIASLLNALPDSLIKFGQLFEQNEEPITKGLDAIGKITDAVSKIADFGKKYIERKADIEGAQEGAIMLVPVTAFMVEIVKNYAAMEKALGGGGGGGFLGFGKKEFSLVPIFDDISNALLVIQPGIKAIGNITEIMKFSMFTSIIERLARVSTPFEKFTKSFTTFSKDMGVFVKNWKQFTAADVKNFQVYGDVTDKISKVDAGKLKQALDALIKYEKDKLEIEKERATIVKDIMSGAGDDPSGVMEKLSNLLDSFTGSSEAAGGGGGGDKPITTPKIQVNGSIFVTGNIDRT